MNTQEQFLLEELLKVCAMLDSVTRRGHKYLEQGGQSTISTEDEQARIVYALERLHESAAELGSLILEIDYPIPRPHLYLV